MIDDINTKRTELANQMAAAGAAALDFNATAAVLAAIPDTEPQQYVAAGTPLHHDARIVPSFDGRRIVQLGVQSREFYVKEAAAFIEFLYAFGAARDVRWSEPFGHKN